MLCQIVLLQSVNATVYCS